MINMVLASKAHQMIMLLPENKEMIPTQITQHLNSILHTVSTSLLVLKDVILITEMQKVLFIEQEDDIRVDTIPHMYHNNLDSLKEYIENKKRKKK
jgi:hypothetical protein